MRHTQAFVTKVHKGAACDGRDLEAPGPVRPEREGNVELSWSPQSHSVHGDDLLVVWGKFTSIYEPGDYGYVETEDTESEARFKMFLDALKNNIQYEKSGITLTKDGLADKERGQRLWYKKLWQAWDKADQTPLKGALQEKR